MPEHRAETWLLKLGRVPFIGEWVATLVGLWPLILLAVLVDMESANGVFWWLALSGIALAPWLIVLQRWQGVRINVPFLPIKWLWLTPILIILGVAHIVTSDAFAAEKLDQMELLGARLEIVRSDDGKMTGKLTRDMIDAAAGLTREYGAFWTDQLNNPDPLAAYRTMADEIWTQAGGRVDAFVQCVGTAGSIRGVGERLREHDESVQVVAVEPAESAVLSGGPTGAHKIDGVGAGFVVPLWRDGAADHIERVSTEEAVSMAVRLAREEGLFAGTSTGANVVAALRFAERLQPGSTIVLVMCDTGMKYLSNPSFQAHTSWR